MLLGYAACRPGAAPVETLFERLPSERTGIDFANELTDTQAFNVFTYRNYYNGGGVGVGDFDGNGLPDLYFTANQAPNRLYLNRGDFRFEEVAERAGVAGTRAWSTGVAVADVNGDGRLDLYVCNAGNVAGDDRQNELFLHQGNGPDGIPRFVEVGAPYGLADEGYSTHAAFLDYDRDGDLDLYLVNNSFRPVSSFGLRNIRHERDARGGDKLFRNDGERFADVSEAAGIYGSEIAFGLGVAAGDLDDDGWLDLYVSNDFFERDYLYLNNRDGTFREVLESAMPVLSLSSMGADLADLTGDGLPEVFVTDMLPPDEIRLKTTSSYEGYNLYQTKLAHDYHHQIMRNTLQFNRGDGTFSEIGQIAGVSATDWSWGALLADFDLDGFKDLFVANGIYRDVTDQDFINFLASEETRERVTSEAGTDFLALVAEIPSHPIPNFAFQNDGRLDGVTFSDRSAAWGLGEPSFSNGSAYVDLDLDGDLDLVVNNVNQEAFVYRNRARERDGRHFLQVALEGEGQNTRAVGARVAVWQAGRPQHLEHLPQRGFQSSVDFALTFGLGDDARIDSLTVLWPDGRRQTLGPVDADQRLTLRHADAPALDSTPLPVIPRPRLRDVTEETGLAFRHRESDFVDFHREALIPKMLSREGPAAVAGDVDGDGRDDLYLGGAAGQSGALFVQRPDGRFGPALTGPFAADAASEDVAATFFDAEGDGDLDLHVVSGSNEFEADAAALADRLYLNEGAGRFTRARGQLPTQFQSGSTVAPADIDTDGDMDLFVGARSVPWQYGVVPRSTLLLNDGRGKFSDATEVRAPALRAAGLVTDAVWADMEPDGDVDLLVVGEWMPVRVFTNDGTGRLAPAVDNGLAGTEGWWTRVAPADFDGDGDTDFVAGNLGLNTKLQPTAEQPIELYVADFDGNGSVEQILTVYRGDRSYPFALRNDLTLQLPVLKREILRFADYAGKTIDRLMAPDVLAGAVVHRANTVASTYFENRAGRFVAHALPFEAQWSPVYGLLADDVDGDGRLDVLLAGNFDGVRTDLGRMAASYGLVLRGLGEGRFEPMPAAESGFVVPGETRRLLRVRSDEATYYLAAKNDDIPQLFRPALP